MDEASAHRLATEVMKDPQRMLNEKVQEELGIGAPAMSPMREAWVTGTSTAIGALIPVFPFLVWEGRTAIIVSFAVAMLSHWLVGAARSVFTGRSVFRSGLDMFVVGLGVAIAGYYVGEWVSKLVA
jgi:predicted membrane protein (TIGR00267 family)